MKSRFRSGSQETYLGGVVIVIGRSRCDALGEKGGNMSVLHEPDYAVHLVTFLGHNSTVSWFVDNCTNGALFPFQSTVVAAIDRSRRRVASIYPHRRASSSGG